MRRRVQAGFSSVLVTVGAVIGLAAVAASASAMTHNRAQAPITSAVPEIATLATTPANGDSLEPAISANGRFIAFSSDASNLVAGDTNRCSDEAGSRSCTDVFLRDRVAGTTMRMSVSSSGKQANHYSKYLAISGDGRFVAFSSRGSNLIRGDTNEMDDVFVRDRVAGTTRRVSVSNSGEQGTGLSYSGAGISRDGRFVAFPSDASNLVAGDTNGQSDVFVRDRVAGTTTIASVGVKPVTRNGPGAGEAAISANGRVVAFVSNSVNGEGDVFVRDRGPGTTRRVSVGRGGKQASHDSWGPSISADGRFVAFTSFASNLVAGDANNTYDVFVRDLVAGTTERVSVSRAGKEVEGNSEMAAISANGRFVAFSSDAPNLVAGDTSKCIDEDGSRSCVDVFVRDRVAGTTMRVSVSSSGKQGNHDSENAAISADGGFVAFSSRASNLVDGDTNNTQDVFVRDRVAGTTTLLSVGR